MAGSRKTILLMQNNRFQAETWKGLLESQNISVIRESPDANLMDNLLQLDQLDRTLPDLLIISTQCLGDNPYHFCRWCRTHFPDIQIILTNHNRREISDPERDWAIHQGASDLLLGFQNENFVSSAVLCAQRTFDLMEFSNADIEVLLTVLLDIEQSVVSPPGPSEIQANDDSSRPWDASLRPPVASENQHLNSNGHGKRGRHTIQNEKSVSQDAPPPQLSDEIKQKFTLRYRGRRY